MINKWVILFLALVIGIVFGVNFLIKYATNFGKDKVVLRDGRRLECQVLVYDDATFSAKISDLEDATWRLEDVQRIDFSDTNAKDFQRDSLTTPSGQLLKCRAIWYENGMIGLKTPTGDFRAGSIDEINRLELRR